MTRGLLTLAETGGRRWIRLLVVLGVAGCGPAVPASSDGDGAGTTSAAGATSSGVGGATSGWSGTSGGTSSGVADSGTTDLTDSTGAITFTGYGTGNLCDEFALKISFCCDAVTQNCGAGEKCTWWANDGGTMWNATRCRPIPAEPDLIGASCTVSGSYVSGADSCEKGAMCFWVNHETLEGECLAYCDPDTSESTCPQGTRCHSWGPERIALCLPDCDPLMAACSHSSCVPTEQGFACLSQHGRLSEPIDFCELTNGCEPGLSCLDAEGLPPCGGEACCAPYCDLTERISTCNRQTTCLPYFGDGPVLPGHENLGFCGLEP